MVKKSSKASASKTPEVVLSSKWSPTGVLNASDSNPSIMKEDRFTEIKMLFKDDVEFVLPHETVGADWYREGWVCLYYYPFEIGMRFPFSKLVNDVLTELDISPGQLMASAWRILACLDSIEEKYELGINVAVVRQCYTTKKYSGGRCGLVSRKKDDPLILNLETVHDRGWKEEFFFMEKANLGVKGDFLREQWNGKEHSLGTDVDDPEALSIVEKIVALPGKERLWPNCLGRPIRNAAPVDVEKYFGKLGSKAIIKYDATSSEKFMAKTVAGRTRGKRTLALEGLSNVSTPSKTVHSVSSESDDVPKTGTGAESFVAHQFSKEFKSPNLLSLNISGKDLFSTKRNRGEKSTETDSSRATVVVSPDAKRVKVTEDHHIIGRKRDIVCHMPVGKYDVGANPAAFVCSLSDSLLPQTIQAHSSKNGELLIEESIGNLYHSFQSALMLQRTYAAEMEKFKGLEAEHSICADKLRIAQARAVDATNSLNKVQREFDEYARQAVEANNKFAEDTKEIIIEHVMRTRVEAFLEHKRGESASWDVDEAVKEYNEKFPEKAIDLNAADDSGHQPLNEEAPDDGEDLGDELEGFQEDIQDEVQNQAPDDE